MRDDMTDHRQARQALKRDVIDRLERCALRLHVEQCETWRSCAKASCARSRRCRGLACGLMGAPPDGALLKAGAALGAWSAPD